jgi:hypothetical protein
MDEGGEPVTAPATRTDAADEWRAVPDLPGIEVSPSGDVRAHWPTIVAARAFPYLRPCAPTRDRLHSCDICHAAEHRDIIDATSFVASITAGLRAMFTDSRDGIVVCLRCAEAGAYLEIEEGEEVTHG